MTTITRSMAARWRAVPSGVPRPADVLGAQQRTEHVDATDVGELRFDRREPVAQPRRRRAQLARGLLTVREVDREPVAAFAQRRRLLARDCCANW